MKIKKLGIRKLLYNDRILMIISVILGIIVWAVTVNLLSTDRARPIYDIPIFFDQTSLEKLNLSVVSVDDNTVDISVNGNRMTVAQLTPEDFIANVSLVGVDAPDTYTLEVQVSKKFQNTTYDIEVPERPRTVTVKFDKLVTKKIALSVDLSSLSTPDGFIIQKHYISPSEVTVSGPESDVSRVAKCVVVPELPDILDRTYVEKGSIALYDVMGQPVSMTHLKLDKDTADVTIPVLKKKTLPLQLEFINVPDGFPIGELSYNMSSRFIQVAGPAETVETMSNIPLRYIDLKQVEPDSVFTFNVELPENFLNIQNITKVNVDFAISGFEVRKFSVKNLLPINVPGNYDVTVVSKGINNVSIVGPPDVLDQITSGDIVAEIDLSDRELGSGSQHNVPVQIVIPTRGTVWAIGDYTVVLTVKEK